MHPSFQELPHRLPLLVRPSVVTIDPSFLALPPADLAIHDDTTHMQTVRHSLQISFRHESEGQGTHHIWVPSGDTAEWISVSDVVEEHAPQSHSSELSKSTSARDFGSAHKPDPHGHNQTRFHQTPNNSCRKDYPFNNTDFKQSSKMSILIKI